MKYFTILIKPLTWITGNYIGQKVLLLALKVTQYLMGIGSGGDILNSGEKSVLPFVKRVSNFPHLIIDVGANQGQFLSLVISSYKSNDDFSLHCFEPSKFTYDLLIDKFGSHENITFNKLALAKDEGELTLHYPFPGTGYASLTKREMSHYGLDFNNSEKVGVTNLDTYCSDNKIENISLLKIDVEGHEFDVLSGSKNLFEKGRIDCCMFEFGGAHVDTGTSFKDFYFFFTNNKMRVYRITPSGYHSEIRGYREFEENYRDSNYLAVKNELI
jgi:FkbM family methyltransferase